jgi:putative transposase
MARLPRLCIPGWPHLLKQTGHNRQAVFRDDADRTLFQDLLREAASSVGVAIHAYGLFDSEVRLLGTPSAADSLSRMMQSVGRRYGSAFNRRHGHVGSLWESRFKTTVIEPERHLLACMRYAEDLIEAVDRSTILGHPCWSSAGHHLGGTADPVVEDHLQYWSLGNTPFEREAAYGELVKHPLTLVELSQIQDAVLKGWPLGSRDFLVLLSAATDRRLTPLPRGRPASARTSI